VKFPEAQKMCTTSEPTDVIEFPPVPFCGPAYLMIAIPEPPEPPPPAYPVLLDIYGLKILVILAWNYQTSRR